MPASEAGSIACVMCILCQVAGDLDRIERAEMRSERNRLRALWRRDPREPGRMIILVPADEVTYRFVSIDQSLFGIAQHNAAITGCRKRLAGTFRDHPPFLFGQRGVNVQHERIRVHAQFGNDERHALRHQTRNEHYIAEKGDPA